MVGVRFRQPFPKRLMDIYPTHFDEANGLPEESWMLPRLKSKSNQYFIQVQKNARPTGCVFCKKKMDAGEFRVHPVMMNVNMCLTCGERYFKELSEDVKEWREHPDRRRLLKGV